MIQASSYSSSLPAQAHPTTGKEIPALIDNIAEHPTPEGLLLTLMPAGLMPRLSAWFIDFLIRAIAIVVISILSAFLGTAGTGIIAIAYFLITWLYPVYFEVYRRGMTPGKKKQGIYVCHDDGTPISLASSMTRNLLRVADFLPFGFAAGILTVMFTQRSQRIGDIVAGTVVVYAQTDDIKALYKSVYGLVETPEATNSVQAGSNIHSNFGFYSASPLFFYPLQLSEQQALVAYSERASLLSEARQQEIASALMPLIKTNLQTPDAKKAAVHQAVLQKAKMIQGQSLIDYDNPNSTGATIADNTNEHGETR